MYDVKNALLCRFEMCAQLVRKYHLPISCFRTSNGKLVKFKKRLESSVPALRPDYVNSKMTPYMKRDLLTTARNASLHGKIRQPQGRSELNETPTQLCFLHNAAVPSVVDYMQA